MRNLLGRLPVVPVVPPGGKAPPGGSKKGEKMTNNIDVEVLISYCKELGIYGILTREKLETLEYFIEMAKLADECELCGLFTDGELTSVELANGETAICGSCLVNAIG